MQKLHGLALSLLVPTFALVGCAHDVEGDVGRGTEVTPGTNEEMRPSSLVLNPAPIVSVTPVALCSTTAADSSSSFPAPPGYRVIGTSDSAKSCDWFTVEVTDMLGKTLKLEVDQPLPAPVFATSKEHCAASTMSTETIGYRPAHWVKNAQGLYSLVDGKWEQISSYTENGVPFSDASDCVFPNFEQGLPATIANSPYSTVRVLSKAVFYTPNGAVRTPMSTYVVPG
jgi:hypothetical protein